MIATFRVPNAQEQKKMSDQAFGEVFRSMAPLGGFSLIVLIITVIRIPATWFIAVAFFVAYFAVMLLKVNRIKNVAYRLGYGTITNMRIVSIRTFYYLVELRMDDGSLHTLKINLIEKDYFKMGGRYAVVKFEPVFGLDILKSKLFDMGI